MDCFEGQLAQSQRTEFEQHLEQCPSCVAYLKTYQQAVQMSKAVCHNLEDDLPGDVPEELVQTVSRWSTLAQALTLPERELTCPPS